MTDGPLKGLKVVEFGHAMAGPFCGLMLGDYGAEVIKVEKTGAGDDSRSWSPYYHGKLAHYFASVNRNKKSIAVDIEQAQGREVAQQLALAADIVIDNYRVGALDEAGIGYEALKQANPRLIYCSISGFGRTGPRRHERANDLFMQAFAGGMSITGETDGGPVKMGISVADIGAGMLATIAILMATEARHRTGKGQLVETSLFEGQIAMLSYQVANYLATGRNPVRRGSAGQVGVPYQAFPTADDWLVIAAFNPRMWKGVCKALEKPEWEHDPRFQTGERRAQNRDVIVPAIETVLRTNTASFWKGRLDLEGVPCTPVNEVSDVVDDEQTVARDMIVEMDVPGLGMIRLPGLPIKMSVNSGVLQSPPPSLGQHSVEVLQSLGYSAAAIDQLMSSGCVEVRGHT